MNSERIKKVLKIFRPGKEELKKTIRELDEREDFSNRNGWMMYDSGGVDKRDSHNYFSNNWSAFGRLCSFTEAKESFDLLKEKGRKSLVLDVMGQGRIGHELGADLSVGWTYKQTNKTDIPELNNRKIETGDLINKKQVIDLFRNLDNLLENENFDLNAIFFRPLGGLNLYDGNKYALSFMYERLLRNLYKRAKIGCKLYLEIGYTNNPLKFANFLKERGYIVNAGESMCIILEKTSDKPELPELSEIAEIF